MLGGREGTMRFILSNYGHRLVLHLHRAGKLDALPADDDVRVLCRIYGKGALAEGASAALPRLAERGFIEPVVDDVDLEAIELRYARNPLEHMSRVVFEYTTLCNLDCLHCRNGNLEAMAEADPSRLRRVVDAALPIGLERFDFIGGEVTLYGKGWLDLVAYIRAQGGARATVITSGWFLGETSFFAAGKRYADDVAYLRELASRGLTHVIFSLDGPEDEHDRCRQVPGLYQRVIAGFEKVRGAGMIPRVSLVLGVGVAGTAALPWIADLSRRIHGPEPDDEAAVLRVLRDDTNYVSNFIDVGGGVKLRRSRGDIMAWSDADLRCKNFFRPSPTLRIKASGEISLCPLVEGGDGYGNVHDHDIVELLNRMQDALVYKLHAEKRIGAVRRFLDAEVFGGSLGTVCSARVALNMIAREMQERGIDPEDRAALRAINVEVAEKMGVLPRSVPHRANGHARPR
ncbi:radical SAM domain protein [Minicystis rosea]|nr:radical SAM domain protein [Minicystis rosea]